VELLSISLGENFLVVQPNTSCQELAGKLAITCFYVSSTNLLRFHGEISGTLLVILVGFAVPVPH
jgi:hypothetical protein